MNKEVCIRVTIPVEIGIDASDVLEYMKKFSPCVGVNVMTNTIYSDGCVTVTSNRVNRE